MLPNDQGDAARGDRRSDEPPSRHAATSRAAQRHDASKLARRHADWRRLLHLPHRGGAQIDADIDDEMTFHLAMREEELRARGLSPAEANQEALRRFGDVNEARRSLRRSDRHTEWRTRVQTAFGTFAQDVMYAARRIVREPLFSLVVILTLALGTGSTIAVASIVRRMLIAPLPYRGAERLVLIDQSTSDGSLRVSANTDLVEAFPGATPSIERVERLASDRITTMRDGFPAGVQVGSVSPGLLSYLNALPTLGRSFIDEDARPGAPLVAMLSWNEWQSRYAASREVLGRQVTIGVKSYTIVGVMPRLFDPSVFDMMPKNEVWIPHTLTPNAFFSAIAVVRAGATIDGVQREVRAAALRIPKGKRFTQLTPQVRKLLDLAGEEGRTTLLLLSLAVGLVLAIACINVANLLLARGAVREREIAVRAAIGASRGRIVRQLITESAMLSVAGGALGIVVCRAILSFVAATRPQSYAALEDVRLDDRMLVFALGLALVTALAFGLGPALVSSRRSGLSLQRGVRQVGMGRAGHLVRRLLVFVEVTCAVTLVIAASLLVRSSDALQHLRLGYDIDHIVSFRVEHVPTDTATSGPAVASDDRAAAALLAPALERLRGLPNVEQLTLGSGLPGQTGGCMCEAEFLTEGSTAPGTLLKKFLFMAYGDSSYVGTLGIRLLSGRGLSGDTAQHEVLVTATTATKLWPHQQAVGKRFRFEREGPLQTVVGVIEEQRSVDGRLFGDSVYFITQPWSGTAAEAVMMRVRGDERAMLKLAARIVTETSPILRVAHATTMREQVEGARAPQRFTQNLLGGFALCALLLAAIGLYGVMSYGVSQRTREIGVRLALGAQRTTITRLILNEGVMIAGAGCVAGVLASLFLNRLLKDLHLQVSSLDAASYLAAIAVVLVVALAALWVPVRRALSVDPIAAVNAE